MPYNYPDNVPEYVKNLPAEAQQICVSAFNAEFDRSGDEDKSRMACWGAVKNAFEQNAAGDWVKKAGEVSMVELDSLDTVQKAYAAHNRLHSEYLDARFTKRKKAEMEEEHEALVRHIAGLGGRHLPKGDALDATLPQELKDANKMRYISDGIVLSDGEPRTSMVQVFRVGTWHHPIYGRFSITDDTLDHMLKNFRESRPKPPTEMVVDWEHMSTMAGTQAPAAGWVKDLSRQDGALFALVEWTPEAVERIDNKEYRFISPEFDFTYKDKETGKNIGPTLLSVALTNRPFLEGMLPVALSETVAEQLLTLVEEDGEEKLAEWTNAYINDLPDSSFAYIKPGGEKDEDGKTTPRSLRYLPYKDKDGSVDLPHLRNALARLDQTDLSPEEKAKARDVLVKAAKQEGVGDYSEVSGEQKTDEKEALTGMTQKLTEILSLPEDGNVEEAVAALKADNETKAKELTDVSKRLKTAEGTIEAAKEAERKRQADADVAQAIEGKKIAPKMKDWATAYALNDPEGFKAYLDVAEPVAGPEGGERGGDEKPGGDTGKVKLTETEKEIGQKMGNTDEELIKAKEELQGVAS